MNQYCTNCGGLLSGAERFCPVCGAPVSVPVPPAESRPAAAGAAGSYPPPAFQQPIQQPMQQPVQPPIQQPVQPAFQQPAQQPMQPPMQQPYQQSVQQPMQAFQQPVQEPAPQPKKKRGKGLLVALISGLVVAGLGVTAFFGFREGGFLRGGKEPEPTGTSAEPGANADPGTHPGAETEPGTNTAAMMEYAKRLEEMGNPEAAAEIYDKLQQGARADMKEAAEPYRDDPRRLMLDALSGEDLRKRLTKEPEETQPPQMSFTDVEEGSYYYEPALWAQQNGIVDSELFLPTTSCTRAQVLTFLWRVKGRPAPQSGECPFADVGSDSYYYEPVLWALENGLISAPSDGLFHPEDPATRAQAVTFLYRAEGEPAISYDPVFADVPDDAYYALPAVWAAENGALSTDSGFRPDDPCTRAEFITMLWRVYA